MSSGSNRSTARRRPRCGGRSSNGKRRPRHGDRRRGAGGLREAHGRQGKSRPVGRYDRRATDDAVPAVPRPPGGLAAECATTDRRLAGGVPVREVEEAALRGFQAQPNQPGADVPELVQGAERAAVESPGWVSGARPVNRGKPQLTGDEAVRFLAACYRLADEALAGRRTVKRCDRAACRSSKGRSGRLARCGWVGGSSEIVTRRCPRPGPGRDGAERPDAKTPSGIGAFDIPPQLQPYLRRLAEGKGPSDRLFGQAERHDLLRWVHRVCRLAGRPGGLHPCAAWDLGIAGEEKRRCARRRVAGARTRLDRGHERALRDRRSRGVCATEGGRGCAVRRGRRSRGKRTGSWFQSGSKFSRRVRSTEIS